MSDDFTDFGMPDTDLTRRAHAFAYDIESEALANHSVRSYLFGRAAAEHNDLRPGADYDDEVLFLACVLHDVGLTEQGDGDQRFELDGADLAEGFVREQGLADDRARLVWEAIVFHTSTGIAHRLRPETALAHAGIGVDVTGQGADRLPEGFADRVHATYPRLETGVGLPQVIVDQGTRNPAKAMPFTLPGELIRQSVPDISMPTWLDMTTSAWPGVA